MTRRLVFGIALSLLCISLSAAERFTFTIDGARSMPNRHGQAAIESMNFELSRDWRKVELAVSVSPHNIRQPKSWFGDQFGDGDENVRALSTAIMLRRRFKSSASAVQPYLELGSGPMIATKRVPAATSHFNFLSQGGFGFVIGPGNGRSFVIGYRFGHISNAGIAPLNSGYNIHTIVFGTQLTRGR